ncbi:MAG: histidinol dehydrogenase [Anaerolineales bacterium]|nr:histidinol dehydrogenase [Anaerolineales bacterium]
MLKLFTASEAQQTILRRQRGGDSTYPQSFLDGLAQHFGPGTTPEGTVRAILDSIRTDGDEALRKWSAELDRVYLDSLSIPVYRFEEAYRGIPDDLRQALKDSAARIRSFHERQPLPSWTTGEMGGTVGQRFTPVQRVGVYVPGGTAPLPSSLLMSVIPAQVAGVSEIVVCTPPEPDESILAAAYLCGVDTVFQIGGAQAIGAMAYGTESIPAVDKIVGAGGLFVTLAKQRVYGIVGLDGLAGPTETMVIADASANPAWVAADLLAQAEHDPLASAILLTPDATLAAAVAAEVERQLANLSRRETIRFALEHRSGVVLTEDMDTAVMLANDYGAEHLCLAVEDPQSLSEQLYNAGGIFLGEFSFEVLGDYVAGPSHVMPTGGTARFASPLNVLDFVKLTSIVALDPDTCRHLAPTAARIADAEGLSAHAAAARIRLQDSTGEKI